MFMAAAAETAAPAALATLGTEIGTAALFGEVAGTGMMMGLPTLGAAFTPTVMNGLATIAPEAMAGLTGTLAPAIQPALTGLTAAQGTSLLNSSMPGMLSEAQIAQMVNPAPNLAANAQTLGQVAQAPTITQTGMQSVYDAIPKMPAEQLLSQAPIDPSTTLPAGTPFTQPGLPGAMTGTPTTLPSQFTQQPGLLDKALDWVKDNKMTSLSLGMNAMKALGGKGSGKGDKEDEEYDGPLSKFKFDPSRYKAGTVTPPTPYTPVYKDYRMAGGGVVELMSDQNAIGANTGYPMADISKGAYATPYQQPISRNVIGGVSDTGVNPMTGEMTFAGGGIADLGSYSDGGRMLKGPGDGMSDNIPATIANKQPARLANEEFVIPADVVSHLGNGSSEAGAKQLYKMMDRVRHARTGKKAQGKQINASKMMPA
jgi:hypothetical protein